MPLALTVLIRSFIRMAPSRSEYRVCRCRWVKDMGGGHVLRRLADGVLAPWSRTDRPDFAGIGAEGGHRSRQARCRRGSFAGRGSPGVRTRRGTEVSRPLAEPRARERGEPPRLRVGPG